ncbi:MAG: DUF1684 domain-containing protein [Saprospiraceae bacterium]|nr:DUF1684 domain-containing protein [Saprospiraceae bacterium]
MGHRKEYLNSFLTNPRSPLDSADLKNISFFETDKKWKKKTTFILNTKETILQIPTYSGITKPYRVYGYFTFLHDNKKVVMEVYQSAQKPENPMYKNHLFLPFKDETNDEETYGGGRYLDVLLSDIKIMHWCWILTNVITPGVRTVKDITVLSLRLPIIFILKYWLEKKNIRVKSRQNDLVGSKQS